MVYSISTPRKLPVSTPRKLPVSTPLPVFTSPPVLVSAFKILSLSATSRNFHVTHIVSDDLVLGGNSGSITMSGNLGSAQAQAQEGPSPKGAKRRR